VTVKFKADSRLLMTFRPWLSETATEHGTFRELQNGTCMNFYDVEDKECSRK